VGILICYDVEFPEIVRVLKLRGCELIVVPTASMMMSNKFLVEVTIPSRCFENALFIAYINRVGLEIGFDDDNTDIKMIFGGSSIVCGPNGGSLISTESGFSSPDAQESNVVDIILNKPEYKEHLEINPYVDDRRPEFYTSIAECNK